MTCMFYKLLDNVCRPILKKQYLLRGKGGLLVFLNHAETPFRQLKPRIIGHLTTLYTHAQVKAGRHVCIHSPPCGLALFRKHAMAYLHVTQARHLALLPCVVRPRMHKDRLARSVSLALSHFVFVRGYTRHRKRQISMLYILCHLHLALLLWLRHARDKVALHVYLRPTIWLSSPTWLRHARNNTGWYGCICCAMWLCCCTCLRRARDKEASHFGLRVRVFFFFLSLSKFD